MAAELVTAGVADVIDIDHLSAHVLEQVLLGAISLGLIHLLTYDWNVVQCIVVIGTARMVLTLAWILTKNIWVSTGAHIINDWTLIGSTVFLAPLAAAT